jgi:phosphatidylserine/phosphatidylglycerophosphate/cardiolipin synthase-like enzyme
MNWFKSFRLIPQPLPEPVSILYDETTFYNKFKQDLLEAKQEVIIESPFITTRRLEMLKPVFETLIDRGIKVFVMTRDPLEHDESMSKQAEIGIRYFEILGVQVLLCEGGHHRKLAIIDRKVFWEGSLNILSQNKSREIMRRIDNKGVALEMFEFLKLNRFIY